MGLPIYLPINLFELYNMYFLCKGGLMSCRPGSSSGLEGELKSWVEEAEHGVVYLSFGSVVRASEMPETMWVDTT